MKHPSLCYYNLRKLHHCIHFHNVTHPPNILNISPHVLRVLREPVFWCRVVLPGWRASVCCRQRGATSYVSGAALARRRWHRGS